MGASARFFLPAVGNQLPELCPAALHGGDQAHLFQGRQGHQRFAGVLLPQLCKQGLHILGVPAPGLQFPVNGNDITALRRDQGALLGSQRAAAAQSLHQRGLLGGGVAKARRVQLKMRPESCAPRAAS